MQEVCFKVVCEILRMWEVLIGNANEIKFLVFFVFYGNPHNKPIWFFYIWNLQLKLNKLWKQFHL